MCEVKPGPRCATDTCLEAAQRAELYTQRYPEGPDVGSLVGAESVGMLHARVQVAKTRWNRTHAAIGEELARDPIDEERLEALRRDERICLTEYQLSQEVLHGTWERRGTRNEQDQYIKHSIKVAEPDVERFDADGFSERTGLNKHTGLDRDGFNAAGFRTGVIKKGGAEYLETVHKETGTHLDPEGYDRHGYRNGVDRRGFKKDGLHSVTGRKFGPDGYDVNDVDRRGWDRLGYNAKTGLYDVDEWGYNRAGEQVGEAQRSYAESNYAYDTGTVTDADVEALLNDNTAIDEYTPSKRELAAAPF